LSSKPYAESKDEVLKSLNATVKGFNNSEAQQRLKEFGYVDPLIVNRRNNQVIGGNQRLKVLQEMGYNYVDVVLVDLDDSHGNVLAHHSCVSRFRE
jgi:hypothetical protein